MNKKFLIILFFLFITCGKDLPVPDNNFTVQRNVSVEIFTSTSCTYCPVAESVISLLKEEFKDTLNVLKFHIGTGDTFAFPGSNERGNFYSVSALPTVIIDGITKITGVSGDIYKTYKDKIRERVNLKSPVFIELEALLNINKIDYKIDIYPVDNDTFTEPKLLIILKEDSILYNASNGKTVHNFIVRRIIVQDLNSVNDTINIIGNIPLDTLWKKENLSISCILQDYSTKEVIQSKEMKVQDGSHFDFNVTTTDTILSGKIGKTSVFPLKIINTGNTSDTVIMDLPDSLSNPQDLSRSLCDSTSCYPLPLNIFLKPGDTISNFEIHIIPQNFGLNYTTLIVSSKTFPSITKELRIYVEVTK